MRRAVDRSVERAARRWAVFLGQEVDRLGITDTGGYRDGFKVTTTSGEVATYNDHPAAGVIELGCAPHPVSREGQELIRQWCMRKLGLGEAEARSAAFLICRKIAQHGQVPQYVVRDALPTLYRYYTEELTIELRKAA